MYSVKLKWETCGRCEQSQKKRTFTAKAKETAEHIGRQKSLSESVDSIAAALPLTIIDVGMDPATWGQMKITITQERVCGLILCKSSISQAPRRQ